MRVGFLYPAWTKAYGIFAYFAKRNSSWPPMNLALLGAIVQSHGHEAFIVDGMPESLEVDDMVERTLAQNPDIVGLTSYSPFFHVQVELAKALKAAKPDLPIMIGGSHCTIVKEKALLDCFDYVFAGEAETALPEFLNRLENGESLEGLKGLYWRDADDTVHSGGVAVPLQDFDSLPIPDRELIDNQSYRLGTLNGRDPFTLIQMTRGCPWRCIFCASDDLNTTLIRRRSPESVVSEIEQVVEKYNIRHFFIVDDVLTLNDSILDVCDLILEKGLRITFEGSTRANLVNTENIKKMTQAGLIRMSLGLETVDAEVRQIMKKKVPLKHYVKANRIMNDFGVEVLNSVMLGLPGEQETTVRKLFKFLSDNKEIKQANLAIAVPYPGTELYRMAKAGEGGITLHSDDFSEYRRYGAAVTTIGDMTPKTLVELQNEGFLRIYMAPSRWRSMYGKHGIFGFVLLGVRGVRYLRWQLEKLTEGVFESNRKRPMTTGVGDIAFGHEGDPKNPNG
jgi:anaerobic magnesium-protoporphyrin IX monomethyl ester cyclase